ncbi:hypothetical protein BDL97_19G069500 [Sphagnum fallax]|nr:hypothetical protein BDL97_19G069500 [Sphagnum fallax]
MESAGSRPKDDVSLPKATMTKIIKEMLPPDVRVAKDAQDLLVECCVGILLTRQPDSLKLLLPNCEFINLISSESNEICSKEEKRTIAPEHVLRALEILGFGEYLAEVQAAYEQHKNETMESPKVGGRWAKEGGGGMTEEEAIAAQQRMFAEARARMNSGTTVASTQANDSE